MGAWNSKKYNPDTDIPDLTGRIAFVTGGNAGIGYHTVKLLATHGAKVYIGARNESRVLGAITQLESEGVQPGNVHWIKLDLVSAKSSKLAAEEFMKRESRLDILINNAAIPEVPETHHNIDAKVPISESMSTNHLGHFVLTTSLLPALEAAASVPGSDVRVVTLSSPALNFAPLANWKDISTWRAKQPVPNNYAMLAVYGTNKLANILFMRELQAKFDEKGTPILSLGVHPGLISTGGALYSISQLTVINWFTPIISYFMTKPSEGAYTTLFAATAPEIRSNPTLWKATCISPVGVIENLGSTGNFSLSSQKDLWEMSEMIAAENLE